MCGIAGIIGKIEGSEGAIIVRAMMATMQHRGPNDSGLEQWTFGSNSVVFGHTRLAIIDLSSSGHQPMRERSGRYWTVFNGEIYNFRELRGQLDPDRQIFQTSTDTEAILHSYQRWSVGSFGALRGMFAFALLDQGIRSVYLVRDPLGIKPLYYYEHAGRLFFASEVGALLASGQIPRRLEQNAISHFLRFGWVGSSGTAVSGVRMLPPGHTIRVDLNGEAIQWTVDSYEKKVEGVQKRPSADRQDNVERLQHILEDSVRVHLLSDVPLGLFLSGGIDSTAILHLMRRVGSHVPRTFTVVFEEAEFNEGSYASEVARLYDAQHEELCLTEATLLAQLPCALEAMDQPTMDGVNTFVLSKAVRAAGVTVALSGLGADELFAGYPSFWRARFAKAAAKIPLAVRAGFAACGRRSDDAPSRKKFWDLLVSDGSGRSAYEISRRLFSQCEVDDLQPSANGHHGSLNGAICSGDAINDVSQMELGGYMTDLLLRDTDFMSMASSLEVRVPFVDVEVVRFVLQLPGEWKMSSSRPKPLLLDAMRGAIPESVWSRRKMGFVLPFDRWMRSALRAEVEHTLCSRQHAERAGLESQGVERAWRSFLKRDLGWTKPWSLFVLLKWCERQGMSP